MNRTNLTAEIKKIAWVGVILLVLIVACSSSNPDFTEEEISCLLEIVNQASKEVLAESEERYGRWIYLIDPETGELRFDPKMGRNKVTGESLIDPRTGELLFDRGKPKDTQQDRIVG